MSAPGPADLLVAVLVVAALTSAWWLLAGLRTLAARAPGPLAAAAVPAVSVVVPARDEAASLPDLLTSLRALDPAPVEVVVVDDASTDGTADLARAGGARVLPAGTPPAGWTGKAWACHTGAQAASGDLLLFLDADTELAPGALGALLALHADRGGLVTVQPHHRVVRPHEQLSAYFNVVAVMASSAFTRRSRDGRSSGPSASRPMAFGPCLLTSRADHLAAGGHEAVRSAILDDAALAEAYHRAGLPVTAAIGGEAIRMRSYPRGPGQLVAGWTKNIAAGATTAAPVAAAGTVLWVSAHHAVAVGLGLSVLAALTGLAGGLVTGHLLVWVLAYAALAWQLRAVLARVGTFRWWAWAAFPLPLLAFDLVFARSAALTLVRRSVTWRGREVDLRNGHAADPVTPTGSDGPEGATA